MRLTIFILFFACITSYSQRNIGVLKITDLEKRLQNTLDTTYIVNFWATWCVPCIKELPDFDSIHNDFKNQKVKVLLVSLDFTEDIEKKVLPFLEKKSIKSEVIVLDEVNGNYFIPRVSEQWTGAIPATLIVNNKKQKRYFFEKKLNYLFLKNQIELIEQSN